ncbi:hypothetical protein [Lichenicoccus roseus]|uniref:DUF465 domain-containing protein n=1 Tax=Lichenicoccus roseus TaxID=2683649 RepID=A0A5R9J1E9_9PROT|nr:hypothetical protein [Lichenicoccus roseus]TLU71480.1 hypothetical protein FE263_16410 [Lichenicoccus roseus]
MVKLRRGLEVAQHEALLQRTDFHLNLVEQQLHQTYGRSWQTKLRVLRRHLRGLQEDLRRRFLEQEVDKV